MKVYNYALGKFEHPAVMRDLPDFGMDDDGEDIDLERMDPSWFPSATFGDRSRIAIVVYENSSFAKRCGRIAVCWGDRDLLWAAYVGETFWPQFVRDEISPIISTSSLSAISDKLTVIASALQNKREL